MLPSENDNRLANCARFGAHLQFATDMLELAVSVLQNFGRAKQHGFTDQTKLVLAGIAAREIRRLRSIQLLCEHGFVENAAALTRSLFDGMLSARFILRPMKPADECSSNVRGQREQLPPIPAGVCEIDFRANLYVAYMPLKSHRHATNAESGKSVDPAAEGWNDLIQFVDKAIDGLGVEWVKRMMKFGYSGLSTPDLSESLGMEDFYREVYRDLCFDTHANKVMSFVKYADDHRHTILLNGQVDRTPGILLVACGVFGCLLGELLLALNLEEFEERYLELKGRQSQLANYRLRTRNPDSSSPPGRLPRAEQAR